MALALLLKRVHGSIEPQDSAGRRRIFLEKSLAASGAWRGNRARTSTNRQRAGFLRPDYLALQIKVNYSKSTPLEIPVRFSSVRFLQPTSL